MSVTVVTLLLMLAPPGSSIPDETPWMEHGAAEATATPAEPGEPVAEEQVAEEQVAEEQVAEEPRPPTPDAPPKAETAKEAEKDKAAIRELCDLPQIESGAWIDRMHRAVYRSVCGSAVWFDNFFGQNEADYDREATFGRLGLGVQWSDHESFKLRSRFKVKLHLPRFEKRVSAFFGNYKEDEFAPDRPRSVGNLPDVFRDTDREWLVGLGYSPVRGKRRRIDVDAGVKLDFPMDPFVRVRFRRYRFLHDTTLMRFRQTLFWRGEKGVGTTSHLDLERVLGEKFHVRWRTLGTVAEAIEGVDWETGLTLFHYLGGTRAMAYELRFEGETDAPVTVEEYGVHAIYRQTLFREWFFVELRGGLTWPRSELTEARNESAGVGIGFELLFGNHP